MPSTYNLQKAPADTTSSTTVLTEFVGDASQYGSAISMSQLEIAESPTSKSQQQQPYHRETPPVATKALNRLGVLRTVVATVVACIGSMSVGFNGAYASPAIPDLNAHRNPFHVTREGQSWFVSVAFLSSIVGALVTSVLVDRLGRKLMIMLACVPFVVAWVTIAGSSNAVMFIVARLISGFSGAVTLTVVSMYIAEIAPASIRGQLMSLHEVLLNVGMLIIYVAGKFVRWNWLAIVCVVPPVMLTVLMIPMPETPRWLLLKGRVEEAAASLTWLRGGPNDVEREILQIQAALKQSTEKVPWSTLFRPPLLKYLVISQILFILQEFSGVNVVRTYTVSIFQSSGSHIDPFSQTIIVGGVLVAGSITCSFVIDRFPRRAMLLFSAVVMTASQAALGTFFFVLRHNKHFALLNLYWLPLVSLLVLVFGYTLGFGPLAFVITNEMFPTRARGRVCSLGVVTLCISGFITTKFFGQLRLVVGDFGVFWFCGCVCFVGVIFTCLCVPETKGKNLEELEKQLKLK